MIQIALQSAMLFVQDIIAQRRMAEIEWINSEKKETMECLSPHWMAEW